MSAKTIRILIKEMEQDGEKYYLARSPDIPWFLAEADTLAEMLQLAPQVMSDFLGARRRIMEKEQHKKQVSHNLFGKLTYDLIYQVNPHLQFA